MSFFFFLTWSGALLESTTSEQVDHRLSSGQHVGYLMCVDRAYGLSLQYLVHPPGRSLFAAKTECLFNTAQ